MFPSHSTCAKHVGNGRGTFISALCLPRRPRQNDFLEFLLKRRATFSNSVAENALTLSHKIKSRECKPSPIFADGLRL
jgi:hypothetical protein